jgi:cation transport regulator ChaB
MYEKEVSLVVASSETASAWQISTTGVYGLPREVTAGGLALKISDFDQCAALIISSNPTALLPGLEQKIHALAPVAAARLAELASLKYVRVLRTVEMLRAEHTVPPNVDALLSQSKQLLDRSEFELSTNDYHEAALRARDAMRYARQAQHVCWNDAIRNLTSPSATPHAASFSTLPDHWKLMHYLEQQQQRLSDNLLASGDFEALRSVSQNGWKVDVLPKSSYLTTTDIVQDSRAGRTLRMIAWKSADAAHTVQTDAMPLLVTTPEIPVSSGDVMLVTGRVRKGPATSLEARRPLVIFDSELGPESSVRADIDSEWSRFEIIRPVGQSSTFSVTLGLMGHASVEEVLIDDLSIRKLPALTASGAIQLTGSEKSLEASGDDPSPENSARTSPRE